MRQLNSCDTYLTTVLTNPLSLLQLCRIEIRNKIIAKMKDYNFIRNLLLSLDCSLHQVTNPTFTSVSQTTSLSTAVTTTNSMVYKSILQILIQQLTDLPTILHNYLYEFPDVPPVPQDIDVFIHY